MLRVSKEEATKNQYFGDERDYFKYDLIIDLATSLRIRRFANIVMLTPPDGLPEGGLVNYNPGNRSRDLCSYLRSCAGLPWRMVPLLRRYFRTRLRGVEYLPYMDSTYFDAGVRTAYFKGVPRGWLQDAVILVDADVGLCPPSGTLVGRHYSCGGPRTALRQAQDERL